MSRDVVEVVARLGDTILDITHVATREVTGGVLIEPSTSTALGVPPIAGVRLRTRVGLVEYDVERVPAPVRTLPHPMFGDRRALGYLVASLAVHLAVWGFAPDADATATAPAIAERSHVIHPRLAGPAQREPARPRERQLSPDYEQVGGGRPLEGAAGRAGSASDRATGHTRLQRDATPQITRSDAIAAARTAGVLGATAARPDAFRALVGTADLTSGFDATNVHAPLYGGTGEANGTFGLSRDGSGRSAGCRDGNCGIIGTGRYGTISNGRGVGDAWGGHPSGAAGGRKRDRVLVFNWNCACPFEGDLDKAIIRRYIQRKLNQLEYCYEKELLAKPNIAGDVVVSFLIAPTGVVTGANATGVDDEVSACVAGVIRSIEFPRSKTDTSTSVTYPFTFRAAGS